MARVGMGSGWSLLAPWSTPCPPVAQNLALEAGRTSLFTPEPRLVTTAVPGKSDAEPAAAKGGSRTAWLYSPAALFLIVALTVLGWVAGVLWWYGPPLDDQATPLWAWPFVPDCPLFGLLGGAALVQAVAIQRWSERARRRVRQALAFSGVVALLLGAGLLLADMPRALAALWLVGGGALLAIASLPGHPLWLAALGGVLIAGQVKYGFWTLTLWALYWRNTAVLYGAPQVSAEGLVMVAAHIGLIAMGLVLFSWLPEMGRLTDARLMRSTHAARFWGVAALAVLVWFGLSDFVDYALGYHPAVHPVVSLQAMRRSTEIATYFLMALFLLLALQAAIAVQQRNLKGAPPAVD